MADDHSHAATGGGNERALWLSLCLTGAFMITGVITGVLSNSLALTGMVGNATSPIKSRATLPRPILTRAPFC